ncbi:MAG TPA: SLC13/DASS family transporter [Nitrospirales bacterium]|nr:SLC13/DASS family transporter [Nitrospirales bacterium]HIO21061.1 SLC13/DASS family transporter [Nitrospirales bacterium]
MTLDRFGLWTGIVLFFTVLLWPPGSTLPPEAQKVLAVTILVGIWWITEALPIPMTSLLPAVLLPVLGIMTSQDAIKSYAHDLIFLLMGGLFLARGIEKWNLHKRIALHIMSWIGVNPRQIVLGCMISAAFLSMWISNTATTLMMLPIALALLSQLQETWQTERSTPSPWFHNFSICLLLGIAYAANVGGMGTLIGTPPNLIFAGQFSERFPSAPQITFAAWSMIALPIVLIFIPAMWAMFVYVLTPLPSAKSTERSGVDVIRTELTALGPMSVGEQWIRRIVVITAFLWIFRRPIPLWGGWEIPGWSQIFTYFDVFRDLAVEKYVTDTTVVLFMVLCCFAIRVRHDGESKALLDWEHANRIPWGMLLLFGGGLAIAKGFDVSGLSVWIGQQMQQATDLSTPLVVGGIVASMTFLTEITSNTATTAILMPIMADTAIGLQIHPLLLMIPATLAASCAFMLPVATLPNAIVFSTGRIPIRKMVLYGFVINLIGIILITAMMLLWGIPMLSIIPEQLPAWAEY